MFQIETLHGERHMRQWKEINPEIIVFDQKQGKIFLKDYRMVLLSACALGALRKEMIETLGWQQARGLLKRFGYAAGLADGKALSEIFPDAPQRVHVEYGPSLHALEGITKVVRIPEKSQVDLEAGKYHVEAYWENSYEAEQHLKAFGNSNEPVCWTLMGYATGYTTAVVGQKTLVVETECQAMGNSRCLFVADLERNFSEELDVHRRDYEAFRIPEVLEQLGRTIEQQRKSLKKSEKTIAYLKSKLEAEPATLAGLTQSDAMRSVIDVAERVAPVDTTVLILGESGTGKELLARGIHAKSRRAGKSFVAVNCSALPESLQEAELFGYAKGAFTGASSDHEGLFESANGGTLFLDEIGDLSLPAQTKILRALQEGEIKRVGENRIRKVDVRVIAATNQELEKMVSERQFRKDLYFRLNVVAIKLPPLRERENDILVLSEHFLRKFAAKFSKKMRQLSPDAKHAIASYSWPGNVRELENAMERAVILADGGEIELRDLPEAIRNRGQNIPDRRMWELGAIPNEADRIARALKVSDGNRERAASLLGISRTTLWRRMQALGIGEENRG